MDFTITVTGVGPLLMHNGRLADPLDPASKVLRAVTSKRNKTEADHEEVSRIEHLASLYIDPDVGPYLPADNIWKSLYESAKKSKPSKGPRVKEGVLITSGVNPIAYTGPRDSEGLWNDKNFVFRCTARTQSNRVVRTRPIFQQWRTQAEGILDERILSLADLRAIAGSAGYLVGMGDWRPKFGRYEATVAAA